MRFYGKNIDALKLWENYVDLPLDADKHVDFLPLIYCPNPDHLNTRSPAFQINVAKPFVHCFSHCGISGTYQHAICIIEGIYEKNNVSYDDIEISKTKARFGEAQHIRAIRMRVEKSHRQARKLILQKSVSKYINRASTRSSLLDQRRSKNINSDAEVISNEAIVGSFSYIPKVAQRYLQQRGIEPWSRTRWELGFDPETDRITIPVRDTKGRLRFFIKRAIRENQRPAYLYPLESAKSSLLFGACNLDESMVASEGLILVEGSLDCIRLHQHGFKNTVAVLGNSLSYKQREEIERINPKRVILFFDGDSAGVRGMERAAKMLENKHQIRVVLYPKGSLLDPAALSKEQAKKQIGSSIPLLQIKKKIRKAKSVSIEGVKINGS